MDRIRAYAAFGGMPKYLSFVDSTRPLDANIVDLLLSASGAVRIQLETVISQEEGLRDYTTYRGILHAVGTKRRTNGEIASTLGLPAVAEWGRWAGKDRTRRDAEIDVVGRLLDGGILTGSAKMRSRPADAGVLVQHLSDLERLADSGRSWAREALEPGMPLLFASTAGFTESFTRAAEDLDHPVVRWDARDLF